MSTHDMQDDTQSELDFIAKTRTTATFAALEGFLFGTFILYIFYTLFKLCMH